MHLTVIAFAAASIALGGSVFAQASYAPAGAQFEARLDRALSTKTLHDGDRFTLVVDVPSYHGTPPALKRAKIEGHVEHVSAAAKDHRATLNMIFDEIVLADGTKAPIDATLVTIGARDARTRRLRSEGFVIRANAAGITLAAADTKRQIEVRRDSIALVKLLDPITTVG